MTVRPCLLAIGVTLCSVGTAFAADPILPDPNLTPGAVFTTDAAVVCAPGFVKPSQLTPEKLKAFIFREYGIDPSWGHYQIDYLIPPQLGGAQVPANLWPQSFDTRPWNAALKDRLEDYLYKQLCAGRTPLVEAQREIAADWVSAYRVYLGEPPHTP